MVESIGFIGLGHMGWPIAENLLAAGFDLCVYDKDAEKTARFARQTGARPAQSVIAAAEPGGIVITMLPNDQTLEEITVGENGLQQRLGVGGTHISLSTISVRLTRRLTALYTEQGGQYVAAGVSGRPPHMKERRLSIFYAGAKEARERILPFLQALGPKEHIYDLGEKQESAAAVNLAMNYPIPVIIMAMAGAAAIAEHHGVPRNVFMAMFLQSPLYTGEVFQYGKMIAVDEFQPTLFPVPLGQKNVALIQEAASDEGFTLYPAKMYDQYLQEAIKRGWEDEDWAIAARVILQETGLYFI